MIHDADKQKFQTALDAIANAFAKLQDEYDETVANLAAKERECKKLRNALAFYANGDHISDEVRDQWEYAGGERPSCLRPPDDSPWMVEDGSIARDAIKE